MSDEKNYLKYLELDNYLRNSVHTNILLLRLVLKLYKKFPEYLDDYFQDLTEKIQNSNQRMIDIIELNENAGNSEFSKTGDLDE